MSHATPNRPKPPAVSCLMLPPHGASHNLPTRPVVLLSSGHPRFATHRPAASITTSHAHRF
jgi:hypothetical protein